MTKFIEMHHRLLNALTAVDQDPRQSFDVAVHQHDGFSCRVMADASFRQARRHQNHALDLPHEAVQQGVFVPGAFTRVSQKDAEIGMVRLGLRPLDDRRKNGLATSGTTSAILEYRPVLRARAV